MSNDTVNNVNIDVPMDTQAIKQPTTYTTDQACEIYNEGQKIGYISAIKQIRSKINDYLNDMIVIASSQSANS